MSSRIVKEIVFYYYSVAFVLTGRNKIENYYINVNDKK